MSAACCPHCGENVADDAPITRGKWWLHPIAANRDGEAIRLTRTQAGILYAIARANGQPIKYGEIAPNLSAPTIYRHLGEIRKALGHHFPVRAVDGLGFAWSDPA